MQRKDFVRGGMCVVMAGALGVPALYAQQDTVRLAAMVVTAERMPMLLTSVTSSVTVLNGNALRDAGVTHLLDALRQVPGVSLARAGSFGAQTSVFVRGGESDYTRVLIDGVPMNDPGGSIDLGAIAIDNVDRVEIVRGPASVLFGSDAVVGVIHVITKSATTSSLSGGISAGTYRKRQGDVLLDGRRGTTGVSVGVARHRSGGTLPFNNDYDNTITNARVVVGARGSMSLRHSRNRFAYPTNGAGRVEDHNANRRDARLSASMEVSQPLGTQTRVLASGTWLDVLGHTNDAPDGPADSTGFYAYESRGTVRRRVADVRLRRSLGAFTTATLGVEYASEVQRLADSSNYSTEQARFAANRVTRAALGQLVGSRGRWSYSVGARLDRNAAFGTFSTARVGAAYRVSDWLRLRTSAGTGFKAPTFFETFSTAFSTGNADLRPEHSRSAELSAELTVARFHGNVTWFDQRFRDLIQYQYAPTGSHYHNIAAARAGGVELDGQVVVTDRVTLAANTTLLRTRVDDAGFQSGASATFVAGQRLLRRPAATTTLAVRTTPWGTTHLDLAVIRVSARDDRDFAAFPATPVQLPAYLRTDISLAQPISLRTGNAVTLLLRADNLFGEHYDDIANFAAPGRAVTVGLRLGRAR